MNLNNTTHEAESKLIPMNGFEDERINHMVHCLVNFIINRSVEVSEIKAEMNDDADFLASNNSIERPLTPMKIK